MKPTNQRSQLFVVVPVLPPTGMPLRRASLPVPLLTALQSISVMFHAVLALKATIVRAGFSSTTSPLESLT